jgi:hydrogenase/urease accessory protein HupE
MGAAPAAAHPLAPAVLDVRVEANGIVAIRWRVALPRARDATLEPVLPADCPPLAPPERELAADAITLRWRADCGGPLAGRTVGVAGLQAPLTAIVRVTAADGHASEAVLTASRPDFVVPATPSRFELVRDYVRLGVGHIGTGPDHLLFVFGLVVLSRTWRRVLATVTAFTVGHSVTLALAVLGLVRLPPGPIELAIALSVLVVALEVLEDDGARPAARARRPWLMAGAFGLLHGLGFASVMDASGLPPAALPLALFAFNLGIELGQVAFVLAVLALGAAADRLIGTVPRWLARTPGYVMGTLAAYWCFERAAAWLGS